MGSFQAGVGVFTTLIQVNVILAGGVLIVKGMVTVNDLVTFLTVYWGIYRSNPDTGGLYRAVSEWLYGI